MFVARLTYILEHSRKLAFPDKSDFFARGSGVFGGLQVQRHAHEDLIGHLTPNLPTRVHIVHCDPPQCWIRVEVFRVLEDVVLP